MVKSLGCSGFMWLFVLMQANLTNEFMHSYDKHLVPGGTQGQSCSFLLPLHLWLCNHGNLLASNSCSSPKYTDLSSLTPLQRCCWTQAGPGARLPRARPCASWRSLTRHFRSWCGAMFARLSSVPPARPAGTRTRTARRTFPSPRFYLERAGTVAC